MQNGTLNDAAAWCRGMVHRAERMRASCRLCIGAAVAVRLAILTAVWSVASLATAVAVFAQQDLPRGDSVIAVSAISVHAARPVATLGGGSALAVRIDSLSLAPAPTLEQVLRQLPLVQVRTNSRGEAQFSLRGSGSDARQVAVLVDGIPLNLGWDHRADLSVLPATAATSLTLVRGLPSMLHGPNVLGGVLEVGVGHHPGEWMPPRSAEISAGVESTGASLFSASFAQPFEVSGSRVAVRAGAGYRDRPGSALPAGVVQPTPAAPYRAWDPSLLTNTDLHHADAFFAVRYLDRDGAWLSLASSAFRAERGIAAELHSAAPRYWRYPHVSRTVGVVSGGTGDRATVFGGTGDVEASIGVDVGRTEIESYGSASYADRVSGEEGDDRTLTLRLLADHTLGVAGAVRGAFTYADIRRDEFQSGSFAGSYHQRIWSAGGETVWSIASGAVAFPLVRVSVGAALDGAATPGSGDKPPLAPLSDWGGRLSATAAHAGGQLLLHAGISRRTRFPSLRELYSGALGRFEPNPLLRPELLTAAEAGFTRDGDYGRVQGVVFYRDLDDAIERTTLPGGRYQRINDGSLRSAGVELLGSTNLGPLSLAGDLTLQRVRLYRPGTPSAANAEYQPDVLVGTTVRTTLPWRVGAGGSARYVGRQYCADPDRPGPLALAASTRLDGDVSRELRVRAGGALSRLELRVAVDNIADAAVYDQCGLPQPGRTLRLQFRAR
jgi:iron complex outermembrane recepter protein